MNMQVEKHQQKKHFSAISQNVFLLIKAMFSKTKFTDNQIRKWQRQSSDAPII